MSIVATTGHRPNKLDDDYFYVTPLCKAILNEMVQYCHLEKPTEAVSRMAQGTDHLWAITALELNIPLTCIIPFKGQERIWKSEHSRRKYQEILSKAKRVIYVNSFDAHKAPPPKQLVSAWLQDAYEYMIDYSQKLIAIYDGSPGETQNIIAYAKKNKPEMPIYLIDPEYIRSQLI